MLFSYRGNILHIYGKKKKGKEGRRMNNILSVAEWFLEVKETKHLKTKEEWEEEESGGIRGTCRVS